MKVFYVSVFHNEILGENARFQVNPNTLKPLLQSV